MWSEGDIDVLQSILVARTMRLAGDRELDDLAELLCDRCGEVVLMRRLRVAELLRAGFVEADIALRLDVSPRTIRGDFRALRDVTGESSSRLAGFGVQRGMLISV
jgi:hypothetical protein